MNVRLTPIKLTSSNVLKSFDHTPSKLYLDSELGASNYANDWYKQVLNGNTPSRIPSILSEYQTGGDSGITPNMSFKSLYRSKDSNEIKKSILIHILTKFANVFTIRDKMLTLINEAQNKHY